MDGRKFELQVQHSSDALSSELSSISEILNHFSETVQGTEIVHSNSRAGSLPVLRSSNSNKLIELSQQLRAAGCNTMIIEIDRDHPPASPKRSTEDFGRFFRRYADGLARSLELLEIEEVQELIEDLLKAREEKRQIFIFGNGGSAANASHMATDFAKERFSDERSLFRVISLTDNVPWISATANDFGYDKVFVNQLKNLLQPGDLVISISSSGNSPNVTNAINFANAKGAKTYGIVGFGGGELLSAAQRCVLIPSKKGQYGYMEDVTSILVHMMSVYIAEKDRARFAQSC